MKTRVNAKTYTGTLSSDMLNWLQSESKRQKRTRRDLIEDALRLYKREQMRRDFKAEAADPEIVELAEWGMEDYSKTLREA